MILLAFFILLVSNNFVSSRLRRQVEVESEVDSVLFEYAQFELSKLNSENASAELIDMLADKAEKLYFVIIF